MKETSETAPVSCFICGGDNCPKDGKPHLWDADVEAVYGDGSYMSSKACSKCGLARIDYDLLRAE